MVYTGFVNICDLYHKFIYVNKYNSINFVEASYPINSSAVNERDRLSYSPNLDSFSAILNHMVLPQFMKTSLSKSRAM